jgi:nucleoside-diphosphate-sugar epimerase
LTSVEVGGAREDTAVSPVGEYAQSRLAGERLVEYFSQKNQTRATIMRLNYAVELRYGVIHDIARAILAGRPIDLNNGYVNVMWQRDANEIAIRLLSTASVPPAVFNVTGSEILSVRDLALRLGALMGVPPRFIGAEKTSALLSDATAVHRLLDIHDVPIEDVLFWVAEWVKSGGKSLGLPTHFEEREGRF